ncbi:hypothetical protein M378DRAFT_90216, partial [Amanita muscaria Koide BX008]
LPTFGDRPSLPYVEVFYREVKRWRPVYPLCTAHSTTRDNVYKGFYIPGGGFLFVRVRSSRVIARDPTKYRDPECFAPERFLNAGGTLNFESLTL